MRHRRRTRLRVVRLEDRTVPANILQVEPIWVDPPHIREFKPDGTFVGQIEPPLHDPRDVVVSPNGKIQVFDGTFSPQLDTYDPTTQTWSSRTTDGWSTVNNLSYGGIAAYGDWVYVTDMQTANETPPDNGIIRFNMATGGVERFAEGHDFIAMCLGLDGYIYAMGGQTGMGNDIYKYDPETMEFLGTWTAPVPDGRGIAVGLNGDYYVGDWDNSVSHYDSAGNFIRSQAVGNGAVDVSLDGQVISGNTLMDLDLNVIGTVGDANYHAGFATPQITVLTPVLSNLQFTSLKYAENAPAIAINPTIEVSDVHSATFVGATVAIAQNFAAGEDVLSFVDANGISGHYDPATGVLTLSGTASIADYQAALRSVRYQNTSENPSTATRSVTYRVDNGLPPHNLSNIVSRAIDISSKNDAPKIALAQSETWCYTGQVVAVDGLSLADADLGTGNARLRLKVTRGAIEFADLSNVTVVDGANNSSTIQIEGTLANLNQVLATGNLTVQVTDGFNGDDPLKLTLNDLGNSGEGGALTDNGTFTIHVEPGPAHLTLLDVPPLTFKEGGAGRPLASAIKATAGSGFITQATVAITGNYIASEDVLSGPVHRLITSNFDPATGILTLSGNATIAQYQSVLRNVRYLNTSQNPSTAIRTMTIQICDRGPLNDWSNAVTRTVQVLRVNTAPVLSAPPKLATPANTAISINGISVADVDANGGQLRLTLRVTRGTIRFVDLGSVTISDGANNSSLISIVGTLAELNAALAADNLVYEPPTGFAGTAVLQLTLNDMGGADGLRPLERRSPVRIRVG
jgi:hypothetical protein